MKSKKKTNVKTRKQMRKEFRKAKKVKKHEFFSKKKFSKEKIHPENKVNETQPSSKKGSKREKKQFVSLQDEQKYERHKEQKQRELLNKQMRQKRIQQLQADNADEDKEIRKLEKQLKLHKRKGKSVPKLFSTDGLDYLLEACDKDYLAQESEKQLHDSDSEFEDDLATITGKVQTTLTAKNKKNAAQSIKAKGKREENEEHEDSDDENDLDKESIDDEEEDEVDNSLSEEDHIDGDDDEVSGSNSEKEERINIKKRKKDHSREITTKKRRKETDNSSHEEDEDSEEDIDSSADEQIDDIGSTNSDKNNEETPKVWEDIYGRTRDAKGNVITTYQPPHLRKLAEGTNAKSQEKLLRLKRQLKGLLNRLAEHNMASISTQIEELYMSNSRNDMNETLCQLLNESLITNVMTPERLVAEHALLIVILHTNVGTEVGAHCLQYMVTWFHKLLGENPPVEDKRINNLLFFITHLYNFKLFHSMLMYEIIDNLLKKLEEKQIELLLMTLRTVGFSLRKDDPVALKSLVLKVQELANKVSTDESNSRLKFMLDMVQAIKNNNMSKIPNYNPELVEHLKKNLRVLIRKGNYNSELKISFQDLLNAEEHGRWWIVGSAWSGPVPGQASQKTAQQNLTPTFSQNLLDLAKKQRMNTDSRKNIFCVLMSAEDYIDAFEKLIHLGLKGALEREIMNVLLHCALQEKNFNPYYVHLATKFCAFDRKYQMMMQCAVWDKVKELKNLVPLQVTNLAKVVGNIILEKGFPISVLKVIEFAELDKPSVRFIRQVLLTILLSPNEAAVEAVFQRITQPAKLKDFRDGLRLFLHHFMLRNAKKIPQEEVARLTDMIQVADKLLSSDSKMAF